MSALPERITIAGVELTWASDWIQYVSADHRIHASRTCGGGWEAVVALPGFDDTATFYAQSVEELDAKMRDGFRTAAAALSQLLALDAQAWRDELTTKAMEAVLSWWGGALEASTLRDLLSERFAQTAQALALACPIEPPVTGDTRRVLPDACDVDEPAEGDAFSAAYARIDSDVSPRGASVFPEGAS